VVPLFFKSPLIPLCERGKRRVRPFNKGETEGIFAWGLSLARLLLFCLAVVLTACSSQDEATTQSADSAEWPTLTAEQKAIYDRTCENCHGQPGTGAPLARDRGAWKARIAKGLPTLVENTINGYRGMPPMGMCMECSQEQLVVFIEYMAGVECDEAAVLERAEP